MDYSDHPVEIMAEVLEDAGLKPDFASLAKMREYMDEIILVNPETLEEIKPPSLEP